MGEGRQVGVGWLSLQLQESDLQQCLSVFDLELVQLSLLRLSLLFVTLCSQAQHDTFKLLSELASEYSKTPKYLVHSGTLGWFVFRRFLQCWVLIDGILIFASCYSL